MPAGCVYVTALQRQQGDVNSRRNDDHFLVHFLGTVVVSTLLLLLPVVIAVLSSRGGAGNTRTASAVDVNVGDRLLENLENFDDDRAKWLTTSRCVDEFQQSSVFCAHRSINQ